MKLRSFLAVVPRAMRITAIVVAASLFAAGVIAGALVADPKDLLGLMGLYWTAALVMGALSGLWLLAVGHVFGDARLRGMRAALWTAVVILLPHLLGFLLYFVLRFSRSVRSARGAAWQSPRIRISARSAAPNSVKAP